MTDSDGDENVRDWETVSIRLPTADKRRLVDRWKEFDYIYHEVHGIEVEKNRTFNPALVRAAFSERTLDDILRELVEEGVDEIDFPAGNEET